MTYKESIWVRTNIYACNFSYRTSCECAGECRFSANLCTLALDVTEDVVVEATRNADMLPINASEDFQ